MRFVPLVDTFPVFEACILTGGQTPVKFKKLYGPVADLEPPLEYVF